MNILRIYTSIGYLASEHKVTITWLEGNEFGMTFEDDICRNCGNYGYSELFIEDEFKEISIKLEISYLISGAIIKLSDYYFVNNKMGSKFEKIELQKTIQGSVKAKNQARL